MYGVPNAYDGIGIHNYTYGDAEWKDLLTAFDGRSITYDASGNPLTYYNGSHWSFGWADGRQLMSAVAANGQTITYTYDVEGTRTIKRVGDVSHTYIWEDGKPLQEWVSGNTDVHSAGTIMYFYYDMNGRPYALQYNGNIYYYLLNVQGDVIRMIDSVGNTVASYEYDPFGNIITATGIMAEANPLRYRGYYYDRETGFYYLNSRYYDPKIGRFINADSYVSTGQGIVGYNMFAYCGNNPVNASDPMGESAVALEWWLEEMWWLCGADTVLPIGDLAYAGGIVILGLGVLTEEEKVYSSYSTKVGNETGDRNTNPIGRRKRFNTQKKAKEAATKAGGGKEPEKHPKGFHGNKEPHYHPNVKDKYRTTPKGVSKHDHYFYPR